MLYKGIYSLAPRGREAAIIKATILCIWEQALFNAVGFAYKSEGVALGCKYT